MKRPEDLNELRSYLIKLEQSIEDLMDNQDVSEELMDEVLTNYYMSYSDVARLKITDPDEIETLVILGNSLAYLYDSVKTENYI
tara:strand:+ start:140 stop:391 length:252 start_codon:yes stop_codon:yes gene_type:complete